MTSRSNSLAPQMLDTISNTTGLAARLRERIRNEGPITFHDWMQAALYDPKDGYYCRTGGNQWGREGDYRTSSERSPLFASTFARYFAALYEDLGRPAQWTISEGGAGDGRFALVVLQTLQRFFPTVFAATSYVIDEVGTSSRPLAQERLKAFADRIEFRDLADVELDPGVIFSNELLDAFPVHRLKMDGGRLNELHVAVGANGDFEWLLGGPILGANRLLDYFKEFDLVLEEGQVADVNLEIEGWLRRVAEKLRKGYVVTADYGLTAADLYSPLANPNGTLRGFQRHKFVDDVLARPGEQDLTTTVNWSFVRSVGARLRLEIVEFERQDKFLLAAGLLEQLELESRQCESEADRLRLTTAAREMILPGGMASHFQVLVQKKTAPVDR